MASNHCIDETDMVLEAHVECLYALIHRIEPSIEAISMFAETVADYPHRSIAIWTSFVRKILALPPSSTSLSLLFSPKS